MYLDHHEIALRAFPDEAQPVVERLIEDVALPGRDDPHFVPALEQFGERHGVKLSAITHIGSVPEEEDRIVLGEDRIGVLDAVSALYFPGRPKVTYDGHGSGKVVADITAIEFALADESTVSLRDEILDANGAVGAFQSLRGAPLDQADRLAGLVGAVLDFSGANIEGYQWGDALFVWRSKDGIVGIAHDQVAAHDEEVGHVFRAMKERNGGDLDRAWDDYGPYSAAVRRERVNGSDEKSFGLLSGQSGFNDHLTRFSFDRERLDTLLLITDTAFKGLEHLSRGELARHLIGRFDEGGLGAIYADARIVEREALKTTHVHGGHAEFTALGFEF